MFAEVKIHDNWCAKDSKGQTESYCYKVLKLHMKLQNIISK